MVISHGLCSFTRGYSSFLRDVRMEITLLDSKIAVSMEFNGEMEKNNDETSIVSCRKTQLEAINGYTVQ